MNSKLSKAERLKGSLGFESLFDRGLVLKKFPLKLVHAPVSGADTHLFGVSVPKRNISSAVARNRIKRQIREAYRLNKPPVAGHTEAMLFIYQSREVLPYAQIEKAMMALLNRFTQHASPTDEGL